MTYVLLALAVLFLGAAFMRRRRLRSATAERRLTLIERRRVRHPANGSGSFGLAGPHSLVTE